MRNFKLTPVFMLSVIAIVAFVPVVFGFDMDAALVSAGILIGSALLVEPGKSVSSGVMHSQWGKVGSLEDVEAQYKEVQANLKQVGDQIKQFAESTEKEIKAAGQMSAETRTRVDDALMKQGELLARLQEVEQKIAAANSPSNSPADERRSVGKMIVESEEMQKFSSSYRGAVRICVPRSAITSLPGSAGGMVAPDRRPGVATAPERRATIRDLLAPGSTSSNSIEFVRETGFVNRADVVSETALKPYSELTTELETANVRVIAHLFKGSRQILDDAPALASYIDSRARYGLMLAEERQFLYGNGTGAELHGIIPQAQVFERPDGLNVVAEQRIDVLRLALLQAELAEFPSTGIVLNPIDWAMIELIKDKNDNYIIGQPQSGTELTLWKRQVVNTQAIQVNEFLVGAFSLAAQIFDRDEVEILISTENDKDFEKNMFTIRAEERTALAVYRPEAFVSGELTVSSGD